MSSCACWRSWPVYPSVHGHGIASLAPLAVHGILGSVSGTSLYHSSCTTPPAALLRLPGAHKFIPARRKPLPAQRAAAAVLSTAAWRLFRSGGMVRLGGGGGVPLPPVARGRAPPR